MVPIEFLRTTPDEAENTPIRVMLAARKVTTGNIADQDQRKLLGLHTIDSDGVHGLSGVPGQRDGIWYHYRTA